MKILFFGDSITDASRGGKDVVFPPNKELGNGYVACVARKLLERDLGGYEIYNRGISGNRIVDLYARIKIDCWNIEPDLINILIGVNDIWHEIIYNNGVEIDRFENIYRMMLNETRAKLPNTKIMICEPFVLRGTKTEENYDRFLTVKEYAKVAKKLCDEIGATYVPLQDAIDKAGEQYGCSSILYDGVHPTLKGAIVIANEWIKAYDGMK